MLQPQAAYAYDALVLGEFGSGELVGTDEDAHAGNGRSGWLKGTGTRKKAGPRAEADAAALDESISGQTDMEHETNVIELKNFNMKTFLKTNEEIISLAVSMYRTMGLVNEYKEDNGDGVGVDEIVLRQFLKAVLSTSVEDVPYHNNFHYFSVLHTTWHFLYYAKIAVDDGDGIARLWTCFEAVELLTVLTAAFSHDSGHIGVTNGFLSNMKHELAIRYNDDSILENYHCCTAFRILHGKGEPGSSISGGNSSSANVFACLPEASYKRARKLMINIILNTDMARHFTLLDEFKAMVAELKAEPVSKDSERADVGCLRVLQRVIFTFEKKESRDDAKTKGPRGSDTKTIPKKETFARADTRELFLTLLVHVADIANPFKTFEVYRYFADALCREFQHQVHLERKLQLPLSQHLLGIEIKDDVKDVDRRCADLDILIAQCDLEVGFTSIFASPSLSVLGTSHAGSIPSLHFSSINDSRTQQVEIII